MGLGLGLGLARQAAQGGHQCTYAVEMGGLGEGGGMRGEW